MKEIERGDLFRLCSLEGEEIFVLLVGLFGKVEKLTNLA
jgi:hypothetical protein